MKAEDKERFGMIMAKAALVYSRDITVDHMRAYWDFLIRYEIAEIENSISEFVLVGKKFPTPADIVEFMQSNKSKGLKKGQFLIDGGRKLKVLN
jgi:hypothetical protein